MRLRLRELVSQHGNSPDKFAEIAALALLGLAFQMPLCKLIRNFCQSVERL